MLNETFVQQCKMNFESELKARWGEEYAADFNGDTNIDEVDRTLVEKDNLFVMKLNDRNRIYKRKIESALERIHNGTFGECEECGEEIGEKRLSARPVTEFCIKCKEEQESHEAHILYHKRSHTHGREMATLLVTAMPSGDDLNKEFIMKSVM